VDQAERLDPLLTDDGRYRLLVEAVTDYAIYMLDPTGMVTSWNPGAQRFKGYTASEIIGEHFSRFYTEEDRRSELPKQVLETAACEGKFEGEGWRLRKDGSRFWAHVIIDPIRDESGTIIGFAKITRDLTERKQAQQALEQAREALFQAQKMEAIGRLTGGIAHDFNNLLMAVLGSLEMVRKRLPEDPKITPLLANAIQGAQRGTSLTQRMLAFARRQDLKPEAVDVLTLVRGMADLLQTSLGPSVLIETRFPLKVDAAHADAHQLELALLNLAVNARDAMPEGGTLTITAREETLATGHVTGLTPGRYVCLSVTDNGEGMDEATLSRAVEPFFTTKGVGKGTGLGLSMVHGMVEQAGGRLVLKSRKEEGTIAELWLRAMEPNAASRDEQMPARGPRREQRLLFVLAVDDDSLVLMNTAAMLEDLGHTVFEAASGKQALDILRQEERVDLVITDQAMPHMTGTQLAEAIRAERPNLAIILATGYAELPPGTDARLPKLAKPFRQEDLARAIAEVVRTKQAVRPVLKVYGK
jgi:PAS domain S-box-containing protein